MLATRKKITAVVLSTAVMFGGLAATAAPASASAASVAFDKCLTPYVNAANTIGKTSATAQKAVLYTGYAKCYYALSQRSDISSQTEISALTNFQNYHGKASIWIGKTGAKAYEQFISKFKLVGLSKL